MSEFVHFCLTHLPPNVRKSFMDSPINEKLCNSKKGTEQYIKDIMS